MAVLFKMAGLVGTLDVLDTMAGLVGMVGLAMTVGLVMIVVMFKMAGLARIVVCLGQYVWFSQDSSLGRMASLNVISRLDHDGWLVQDKKGLAATGG
jgi:hypothetical protein